MIIELKKLRGLIRKVLVESSHEWMPANRRTMLLDKSGIEDSQKEKAEEYLKSMGIMEEEPNEEK